MQITVHDENRLVLHQGPWGLRGMGILFAALGFGVLWYITHGHLGEHNAWVAVVVGGTFGLTGLAMTVLAGDLLCTFDKTSRTVTIQHRRLVQPGTDTYAWSDISDAALEKSMMSSGRGNQQTPVYRPVFVMKDGTRTPWTAVSTGDLKQQGNCVAAVRAFTGWHSLPDATSAADSAAIQRAAAALRKARVLMFPIIGIFVLVGAMMYLSQVKRYLTWQPVRARIVTTSIASSSGDNGTVYRPVVSYAYPYRDGVVIATGSTILKMSSSYRWADGIQQRYRVGDNVTAYINPANPSEGFVVRELSWFPLLFVALPLLMGVLVAHATKNGQQGLTLAGTEHVPILDADGMRIPTLTPGQAAHLATS
ncbi:MAG TPA: DUF3592 domain-containing protein [Gemmatimonadaceae bacterium]|jgi:hypothetical protein|nr:DUF3592 domain-containing protein [Gemmatimonadaceae bacterium]